MAFSGASGTPLSPVVFLERSAGAFAAKTAIIDGDRVMTYAEFADRVRRLVSVLTTCGAQGWRPRRGALHQ